ncbi:SusC/RagA family TonB-linked outer membrane protein [Ferruginibacter yonginensis]|uniref:SusC/RagA family TonB-linked outer membrane protein n=1 Tax=Ferruginibacter yonginensis TaxID=1310416 RepID=A0ABV8QS70_9BACT
MTRILSLFVMFMLFGVLAFAQNRVVTGTVTDEKGLPVEAASVRVVGTNAGTATDQNGNFRLANVAPNATLKISSVGIATKDVNSGSSTSLVISVTRNGAAGTDLNLVTVGALGLKTTAKSNGTSRASVSQTQLTNGRPVNVAQALSGKVSGLSIQNNSSSVNGAPRIVIRGLRSITGNNTALIVLDGVAVPANTINIINPNDIERIDVLKGGQSATLFGSDGVNGAIVITTKKGNRKPEVTFTNTINVESLAYLPRTQHGFGSGSAYGANNNENFHPAENQQYGPAYDGSIRPLGRTVQDGSIQLLPYSDIADIRKRVWDQGYTRQSDISYRAGGDGSSFFLSYQNLNTTGIVGGDKYERNNLRMNASKTYNKISISYDASYSFDNAKRTNSDFYFFALNSASWVPFDRYKDWKNDKFSTPNGYYNDYYNNPYWERDNNRFNTKSYIFNGNFKLDYKATSDLTFTGRVAIAQTNTTQTTTSNNYTYSNWARTGGFVNYYNNDYDRFLTGLGKFVARSTPIPGGNGESQATGSRLVFDGFGVYDKKFNNYSLRVLAGTQAVVGRTKNIALSTASLGFSDLYNLTNSGTGLTPGGNSESQSRKIGGFVDVTGGFKDIVYLHGSYRTDFSSLYYAPSIGYNKPYFSTYGGDIAFNVSELIPSIKNKESKIVDYIKIRAAYNVNGNDNIAAYQLQQIYPNAGGFPYAGLLGSTVGNTLISPVLKPEEIKSKEVGAELSLFENRLVLEGSIYQQKANDQSLTVAISPASGFSSYRLNAANVTNKGYEADIKAIVYRTKDLSINVSANYSNNTNVVDQLFGATGLRSFEYQAPDDRASLNATVGQTFPYLRTTAFQRDAQGRVIVDANDGWPLRTDGRVNQGTTLPRHNLGVGLNIRYKNISFVANAEYRGGALLYHDLGTDMAFTGSGAITAIYNRQQFIWPNSVVDDGTGKLVPNTNVAVDSYKAIYQGYGDAGFSRGLSGVGEAFVTSADFWKLRDVSISYDFPQSILGGRKIIKDASFSVWGRNLITLLPKDNWYTDPELSNTSGNSQGINTTLNTPPVRQMGATLKLVF